MKIAHLAVALCTLALPAQLPAQAPAQGPAQTPAAKPAAAPQEPVYNESADARADIAAALLKAKKENRRVLVQWGANWCGWCKLLHGTLQSDSALRTKLMYEYDLVRVDVGHFDKHLELATELGADFKKTGIPFLTILDAEGKPLVQQATGDFEINEGDKHAHDPKKLLEFLGAHQAPYLDANKVLAAGIEQARSSGKSVLLHFGAPWCGWCHKLENWLARPEVAALIAKDFVELKIDQDRMLGGVELLAAQRKLAGAKDGGVPWIAVLDAQGQIKATSDAAAGNIGYPYKHEEIAHFIGMLGGAKRALSPADLETLRASLVSVRVEDEKRKAGAH